MSILINEVFPNPSAGQEWVELKIIDETADFQVADLLGYTLSDDYHVIYHFDGEENCFEQFFLILVSGLNNTGDSVILKDAGGNIVDEMSYKSSQKDQSWARDDTGQFLLGPASPLADNLISSAIPTPSASVTPSPDQNVGPSSTPSPTPTLASSRTNTHSDQTNNQVSEELSPQQFNSTVMLANYQNLDQWQLVCPSSATQSAQTRLQFIGQKILTQAVKDVIMGSCLVLVAALLLSYDQKKETPTNNF